MQLKTLLSVRCIGMGVNCLSASLPSTGAAAGAVGPSFHTCRRAQWLDTSSDMSQDNCIAHLGNRTPARPLEHETHSTAQQAAILQASPQAPARVVEDKGILARMRADHAEVLTAGFHHQVTTAVDARRLDTIYQPLPQRDATQIQRGPSAEQHLSAMDEDKQEAVLPSTDAVVKHSRPQRKRAQKLWADCEYDLDKIATRKEPRQNETTPSQRQPAGNKRRHASSDISTETAEQAALCTAAELSDANITPRKRPRRVTNRKSPLRQQQPGSRAALGNSTRSKASQSKTVGVDTEMEIADAAQILMDMSRGE